MNRVKAKEHGIALNDVFETLQIYLGSMYVNDFNRFGRTYQVIAQADARLSRQGRGHPAAADAQRATARCCRSARSCRCRESYGPDRVFRYNGYLTADINGGPAPGYSTGQAKAAMERILAETLPNGVKYEWTDLTYQEILVGNSSVFVFPLCVLLVVLVLAALYESWTLPLAIVAIVPMALLSAIAGVWLTGGDNNIFTQIALFVLVGLASKNAILIVEFAKDREQAGVEPVAAALEAARLRLRPDPDDVDRVHHGRRAARRLVGGRRGDASRHRHCRVLRHARRHLLRPVPDTTFLCAAARRGETTHAQRAAVRSRRMPKELLMRNLNQQTCWRRRWRRCVRHVPRGLRRRSRLSTTAESRRRMSSSRTSARSSRRRMSKRDFWKSFNDPQLERR